MSDMSMGDIAYGMADGQQYAIAALRARVQRLENTVSDLLQVLTDNATIEVTDPDDSGHITDAEK